MLVPAGPLAWAESRQESRPMWLLRALGRPLGSLQHSSNTRTAFSTCASRARAPHSSKTTRPKAKDEHQKATTDDKDALQLKTRKDPLQLPASRLCRHVPPRQPQKLEREAGSTNERANQPDSTHQAQHDQLHTTRLDASAPDRVPPFSSSGLQPHERFAKTRLLSSAPHPSLLRVRLSSTSHSRHVHLSL